MLATSINIPVLATLTALGIALTGVAIGANQAHAASNDQRCRIEAVSQNAMTAIRGVVESPSSLSGSYQLNVVSSGSGGSSNINQGGAFEAAANIPVTLGQVTLGSPGAVYDVTLSISSNAGNFECTERLASR